MAPCSVGLGGLTPGALSTWASLAPRQKPPAPHKWLGVLTALTWVQGLL